METDVKKPTKNLTPKQNKFVREYLKNGFNATKAAIKAGYSRKTARSQGQRLLTNVDIKNAIEKVKKEIDNKDIMTATEVLKELSIIGRSDIRNFITIDQDTGVIRAKGFEDIPKEASRALESVTEDRAIKDNADGSSVTVFDKIKFKTHSKIQALDKLGQYRDLWNGEKDGDMPPKGNFNITVTFVRPDGTKRQRT